MRWRRLVTVPPPTRGCVDSRGLDHVARNGLNSNIQRTRDGLPTRSAACPLYCLPRGGSVTTVPGHVGERDGDLVVGVVAAYQERRK